MFFFYRLSAGIIVSVCMLAVAPAQTDQLSSGPLIPAYGKVAAVPGSQSIPPEAVFKVSFDVAKQAAAGELNRALVSGARFLNMHAAAGVKPDNMQLAFVIHGSAVHDVSVAEHYKARTGEKNANAALIDALQKHGVAIYVCGQSAAYHGVKRDELLPGVELALSAMTAHALLQNDGYTLNPF